MDMQPEDHQEPSQPANDSPEPQPNAAAQAPSTTEAPPPSEQKHPSSEEAFAEFRRALKDEEAQKNARRGGLRAFMQKLFRRKKAAEEGPQEAPSPLDELGIPEAPAAVQAPPSEAQAQPPEAAASETPAEGAGAEFRSMVRDRLTGAFPQPMEVEPASPPPEVLEEQPGMQPIAPAPEPEPPQTHVETGQSILSTLHTEEHEVEEKTSSIRQAALEDYVLEPAEPEESGVSPVARVRRSWRDMRPIDRRLLVSALVIVGLMFLGGTGYALVTSIPTPTPAATPTASIVPIPISISLPGGWVFPLGVGYVQGGVWDPNAAQWLSGTEVCRWVSLPWSEQLEAVLRTVKGGDEIKLSMSNYDSVVYKVESIQQVPTSDVGKLAPSTPSLLVILSNQDSDKRWVVIAKP